MCFGGEGIGKGSAGLFVCVCTGAMVMGKLVHDGKLQEVEIHSPCQRCSSGEAFRFLL